MQEKVQITKIQDAHEKSRIVQEVLLDLPDWFGLPESTQNYIRDAKALSLWAALQGGQLLGFVTLAETSPDTGEVHCMGVKRAFHRQGIGRALIRELERFAEDKYIFLQVKTVDEGHYEAYDQTIAFYRSLGFYKLQVFPSLWDEWNPCLVMVKALDSPSAP